MVQHTLDPDLALKTIFKVSAVQERALARLSLNTVRDLFFHFPSRYEIPGESANISALAPGTTATIYGRVKKSETKKGWRSKIPMAEVVVEDATGSITAIWFHQAYIAKQAPVGSMVRLSGKVAERRGKPYLANPNISPIDPGEVPTFQFPSSKVKDQSLLAVYPETAGLSSLWFRHHVQTLLERELHTHIPDPIPTDLLERYHLPTLTTALVWLHTPRSERDAAAARKRFAFQEIFLLQMKRLMERAAYAAEAAYSIPSTKKDVSEFVVRFPFSPTNAQKRAIAAISEDLAAPHPMTRLLEGDVGSGKTAVAAAAAYAAVRAGYEVAYMAPTEILARQHFESFINYFKHLGINVGLITGSECRKFPSKINPDEHTHISRAQLLKWVANGEIPILVGTHALIQKSVQWKALALAIIDEQHRFGVNQRRALIRGTHAEQTQNSAEKDKSGGDDALLYRDLTYRIRTALFNVKKELGGGHKEVVYQRALAEEFTKLHIPYKREVRIPILYNKKQVGIYQPDFVIEDKIILELKALPFAGTTEKKQLWTYLKGSAYTLALLANFGPKELTVHRIIYEKARSTSFGVSSTSRSASVPHLLSMTATPIPRTLALTLYGDLDLTLLDELPKGRSRVITEIVPEGEREKTYTHIRTQLEEGRQCFVICPRIEEPDPTKELALQVKSAKAEAKRLQTFIFPDYEVGLVHGKQSGAEKDAVMQRFLANEIHILVSTSVVEVGVNVPNATVMVIEGAERFGLAQLHQLRGRVARSSDQAYCYLFVSKKKTASTERLKALVTAKNGFELAEEDLKQRGAGSLSGATQSGLSDLAMEALKNLKLVEAARSEAQKLITSDPTLSSHPLLASALANTKTPHFE